MSSFIIVFRNIINTNVLLLWNTEVIGRRGWEECVMIKV